MTQPGEDEKKATAPMVSVVIAVYNMEDYLEETLTSVFASDCTDMEVVIVDDGSTDGSLGLARRLADEHPGRMQVIAQPNAGVCAARNRAVAAARGKYIFPVDADDRIGPTFVRHAVECLERDPELKVVWCHAEFFGARTGAWRLPDFSLRLLARKNMIPASAVYRRSDWERVGGYCKEIIAREDWEFWISVLKDGGRVERLPEVGLYYRIRPGSKRVGDRALKRHVVNVLNRRHPEFFQRQLGGPLRYRRSWSRLINRLDGLLRPRTFAVWPGYESLSAFILSLPRLFDQGGRTIYKGRNELKEFQVNGHTLIVKSYRRPHLINRIAYTFLRPSKAARSCLYADRLTAIGVGTPAPVGYCTTGSHMLMDRSFSVSLKSACPHTYRDFAAPQPAVPHRKEALEAIAQTAARMHQAGLLHKDFSAGNILFDTGTLPAAPVRVELVDLNRMAFGPVDMERGCRNFERLPATEEMLAVMAGTYARARGYDAQACLTLMRKCMEQERRRRAARGQG